MTLLEPLAAALDLGVEELMACRRQERREEDETMKNLLALSGDNLRAERSQNTKKLALLTVLLLAAVTGLIWFWLGIFSSEQVKTNIELKETVNGVNYIYVEQDGQLLRLKCGKEIGFDALTLTDDGGDPRVFQLDYRWNRRTHQGVVKSCEATETALLGGPEGLVGSMTGLDNMRKTGDQLFGFPCVFCEFANAYPNPYGKDVIYSYRFWSCDPETWDQEQLLLTVQDCLGYTQYDYDSDGVTELVVRTRWEMKPYIVYDMADGEIVESWPDTVDPKLAEKLLTGSERQERLERETAQGLAGVG